MNRTIKAAFAAAIITGLLFAGSVRGASPQAGQCDGYNSPANTKVDTSDGSIVLEAGLLACFKAGDGNTGAILTDGVSTIADYILASGLLNEGGQVPNISNYVVYGTTQPTEAPSSEPSTTPSEAPSTAPSAAPSVTPSEAPSEQPTEKPQPKPAPSMPNTAAGQDLPDDLVGSNVVNLFILGLLAFIGLVWLMDKRDAVKARNK